MIMWLVSRCNAGRQHAQQTAQHISLCWKIFPQTFCVCVRENGAKVAMLRSLTPSHSLPNSLPLAPPHSLTLTREIGLSLLPPSHCP